MSVGCEPVCGGGVQEGTMPFGQLSADFQSLCPQPTSKLGPSGADSRVGGFVYILGPCGSFQQTLLWGWEFLLLLQLLPVFSARGFEALFPHTGTLGWAVCLSPWFILVYLHANVGLPPPCSESSLSKLHISTPPTSLDECFFFNSLVVGLPSSLIF